MKKTAIIIILIIVVCTIHAEDNRKIRFTSSGLFWGKYKYNDFDERATAEFPITFSLGLEVEKVLKNKSMRGIGFNAILPTKLINKECLYDSNEYKLNLKGNYAIYLYNKVTNPIGNSNFYARINYGSGLPYFFYGAFGLGFEFGKYFNVEVTLNGHYTTIFWASSSIKYISLKTGFNF